MAGVDYPGFEAPDTTVIWRYMTMPRYRDVLAGRLYFAAAHQFEDSFEGAITEAAQEFRRQQVRRVFPHDPVAQQRSLDETSRAFADLRRMTKMNCWHARSGENVAMWERYLRGAPGVAVGSTVRCLKDALRPFRLQPDYGEETVYVGRVSYVDYAEGRMTDASMLAVFLHKRAEYADEAEVRAVLSLRMATEFGVAIPDDGVVVAIDAPMLVKQVRAWPGATADDVDEIGSTTAAAGVRAAVRPSSLTADPFY